MRTTATVLDAIRAHGRDAYPEECCGVLLGSVTADGNEVAAVHRAPNRHAEERERRYTIAPDDYRAAEAAGRDQGLDVVGFYHSHPDHPARPSETDLAEATFPGYTYIIVAVEEGEAADLTAWALAPDRSQFIAEEVEVSEPTASS